MNENALVVVTQALASPAMQSQFKTLLPPSINPDRFTEVVSMAIRQSPDVLNGDRQTLYDACLTLARRGLLPDKKEAALVVFNTKDGDRWIKQVQAMPMVEGIIKEMAKAGVKAYAQSVYEKDHIEVWADDDGQHVKHIPVVFGDRGARVGVFAAGKTADGRTYVEAMSNEDIAKVRSRSKQKDKDGNPTGTWRSDPERMEQKSALHRLRKRIPILDDSEALQNLKDFEEESDIDLTPVPTQPGVSDVPVSERSPTTAPGQPKRPKSLQSVVEMANGTADEYPGDDII